jgi:hypothetical protein
MSNICGLECLVRVILGLLLLQMLAVLLKLIPLFE